MRASVTNRWAAFASLSLIFFVVSAGAFSSLGVVLPAMVAEMRWNWTQAGLGYTLLGVACGLASFTPAMLIRRIGVRGTMAVGTLVMTAGFTAMWLTHNVWVYLLATLLIGVSFSLVSTVPGTHVLTGLFTRRSTVLGTYFTMGALGGVAGPLLYVAVQAVTHGWRGYWALFVIAALGSGLFAVLTTPAWHKDIAHEDLPPEQVSYGEMIEGLHDWPVRRALRKPQFYVIVGAYTMYLLINTTAHGFAVEHLTERGVDPTAAAAMLSIEALIGAVVSVIGGLVGERVSSKTLLVVAMVALTIGMAALAEARDLILMGVYAVGVGLAFGLTLLASTMLLLSYFGKRANLELYSIMCLMSTSAALGPAFGGWARDVTGSFSGVLWACTAASAGMILATVLMRRPAPAADAAAHILARPAP